MVSPAGAGSLPGAPASVEPARPDDFPRIAEITVAGYVGGGLASPDYAVQLADVAGRAARSELLVARDDAGAVVGSVALVVAGDFGEVTESPDEAAFRMLVVAPGAQGRGVGQLLVTTCLDRARAAGKRRMVLSTDPRMTSAQRLYAQLGFHRLPERDWSPAPGIDLLVYARDLSDGETGDVSRRRWR